MKAFGSWGTAASFQLGGVIGCAVGIAGIALGGWVPLVGVGIAIVVAAVTGVAINAYDKTTGSLQKTMSSTGRNLITGAAVAGLATTVALSGPILGESELSNDVSTSQINEAVTSEEIQANESANEMVEEVEEIVDPYGCDLPELTPEEKTNCGRHYYVNTSAELILELDPVGCQTPSIYEGEYENTWHFQQFPQIKLDNGIDFYENIGKNTYQWIDDDSPTNQIEIVFTNTGYTKTSIYVDTCEWRYSWAINE